MVKILEFDEVIKQTESLAGKKCVLLGNGFSMAYDKKRFSFTDLLKTAIDENIIDKDSNILKIFEKLKTADFEKVIRYLNNTISISEIYFPDTDKKQIKNDIRQLKKYLVNTITNNHPDKVTDINPVLSENCAGFLSHFQRIYTLNYDLLSYWVIMKNKSSYELGFTDGFGDDEDDIKDEIKNDYVTYKDSQHELLFLHGGLHLFDNKTSTIKLTFSRTSETLKKQIYKKLVSGIYPVFISEGTSDDKLEKIRHNYYLNHCYKALKNQSGSLVIFGTTLKSNDDHIRKAILESKFRNIFIGIYSDDELSLAESFMDEVDSRNQSLKSNQIKNVFLYNSKSINPWNYIPKE